MGFLKVVFLSFCFISFGIKNTSASTFDVTNYGAMGDGDTDDTEAFVKAWADVCGDNSEDPTLVIPSYKTFLIRCVSFIGPCNFPRVHVKLLGDITAPKSIEGWEGCDANGYMIHFTSVHGLTFDGPGQIDGQGSIWWSGARMHPNGPHCDCPTILHFNKCDGLQLRGTTHINSPKHHISINDCHGVEVGNLKISAPKDSPNTDGLDISQSSHVNIYGSVIETGDDCVAINSGTSYVNIRGISCGPGHGISIGSLGKNHDLAKVDHVTVRDCIFSGTANGLRIKTIPYGTGYARHILFEDIQLENVKNPIIIDQHYCANMQNAFCPAPPTAPAIHVGDVTYNNIYGTSASKEAIIFNCSEKFNCTGIRTNNVKITGYDVVAICNNVKGKFIDTVPKISCN